MGVSTTTRVVEYPGPFGPASNKNIPFKWTDDAHIKVEISDLVDGANSSAWAITTDFTLAGVGGDSGTLTTVTDVPADKKLTIYREIPLTRIIDYIQGGKLNPDTLDTDIDILILIAQQLQETLSRALIQSITASGGNLTIPNFTANEYWAYDAIGNLITTPGPVVPSLTASPWDRFSVPTSSPQSIFNLSSSVASADDLMIYRNGQLLVNEGTAATNDFEILSPTQIQIGDSGPGDTEIPGTTSDEEIAIIYRTIINQSLKLEDFGVTVPGAGPTFLQPDSTTRVMAIDNNRSITIGGAIVAGYLENQSTNANGTGPVIKSPDGTAWRHKTTNEGEIQTDDGTDQYVMTPDGAGTTANRPAAPGIGWRYWNTDTSEYEVYNGSAWIKIGPDITTFNTTISPVTIFTAGSGGAGYALYSLAGSIPAGNECAIIRVAFVGVDLANNVNHHSPNVGNNDPVVIGRGTGGPWVDVPVQINAARQVAFSAGINPGGSVTVSLVGYRESL